MAPPPATRRAAGLRALALASAALLGLAGCHSDMYDQPKLEPYEPSTFFHDGQSNRPLVPGVVARGELRADAHLYAGKARDGKDATTFPFPVDRTLLDRGRERYNIYCMPCHAAAGHGNGMIVERGFSRPPSFHSDELRNSPVGHYFDVITNGYGAMYSYASRVPPRDRWAIIAYIRALQLSQGAKLDDLPAESRRPFEEAAR